MISQVLKTKSCWGYNKKICLVICLFPIQLFAPNPKVSKSAKIRNRYNQVLQFDCLRISLSFAHQS